ncbi:MAG: RES family NAD+ phosphorylase [Burkholderiales bacterium]
MPKRSPRPPPSKGAPTPGATSILELDRFTEASLEKWRAASKDLDELQAVLYFAVEPHRRRLRPELIAALQQVPPISISGGSWCRIVSYRYSLQPLSCAGSLQSVGGRFNAGADLDETPLNPWPALYLAQDYETAFREKFQMPSDHVVEGLKPHELALEPGASHSTVLLRVRLNRVFDMTATNAFDAVAQVFRKIKIPPQVGPILKRLKQLPSSVFMTKTPHQLRQWVLKNNWRVLPMQYGLPAQSQILAELIRAAGYEGILYPSTKGSGQCLAVYPELLSDDSFVELADGAPPGVEHPRLDSSSADELAGWDSLPPRSSPRV